VRYTSPVQFPAGGDTQEFGPLTVDLADLNLANDATYRANVEVGSIVVIVPPELNVVVRYRADAGSVNVFDRHIDGTDLADTITDPQPKQPKQRTLTLELGVDLGSVEVRR
jgi:predicted membrane protein